MAEAILMSGGVGGVTSDDVTASKAQVLQGYRTVTADSDDEIVEGTIIDRNYGNINGRADILSKSGGKVSVHIPEGYYHKTNGGEDPWIWITLKEFQRILKFNKDKVLESENYLGEQGTIPIRGYHGPDSTEVFMYQPDGGYVVRLEEGYYHKGGNGQWKPYVVVPPTLMKSAVNYHPEKTLSDTRTCEEQGQIKMVDTKLNNYTNNQARNIGIDKGRGKLWMEMGHGNAYYYRDDNVPHVEVDATRLGTAGADSVLQWQTATSQHGINFQGTIPRWICNTGDVISAVGNNGFAWDDTYANRGRGIVTKIPNNHYIQGANYVFLPAPFVKSENIREGVNMFGVPGGMKDYGAGRVAFRNATFDGVLISGVANIGLGDNLNVYSKPSTEIRDGIIRFYNGGSVSGGGLHQYKSNTVLEEAVTLAHSVNLTPFRTIRLGLKYPYGGRWGTVGGVGSLVGVLWALPTNITPEYFPSRNAKIHPNVIKRVGYRDGVIPATQGQWNTPTEIPAGAEYFVDIDVSDLQGHHRMVLGIAVSEANHSENFTIQVIVYVNNGISGISHIEFIN